MKYPCLSASFPFQLAQETWRRQEKRVNVKRCRETKTKKCVDRIAMWMGWMRRSWCTPKSTDVAEVRSCATSPMGVALFQAFKCQASWTLVFFFLTFFCRLFFFFSYFFSFRAHFLFNFPFRKLKETQVWFFFCYACVTNDSSSLVGWRKLDRSTRKFVFLCRTMRIFSILCWMGKREWRSILFFTPTYV